MLLLPGGRFGRRGVRAARRLRDFTWCDEFVRFLRSLQNKKFLEFQFHARRKKALPLSEASTLFASTTRDPPRRKQKKRRCPTTIVRAPLFFLSWCSSTPSRRRFRYLVVTSSKRRGECVCVDIRKNISLCHSCLFLPTINRIKGRLLKKNYWLSRVFRSKKSTHPRHGKWKRTFSSTDKKACACVDFSFFTEYKNPKTKRHFFGRHFYVPAQKRQKPSRSPGTILKEADEDNSHA